MTVLVFLTLFVLPFSPTVSATDDPPSPLSQLDDELDSGNLQAYEDLITDLDTLQTSSQPIRLRLRWSHTTPPSRQTTGTLQTSHLLQRVLLDFGRWNGHLLVEKDPEERRITDFITGYIEVKRWIGLDRVTIGDLRPGAAQGLVFSRPSRMIFSPDLFKRHDAATIGYTSTSENGALRGIALTKTAGPLTLCGFISRNHFDASTGRNGVIFGRRESGLHVTPGERAGEDAQQERLVGWRWRITHRRITLGGTGLLVRFSPPFGVRDPQKDPFDFQGDQLQLTGLDWDTTIIPRTSLFGEIVVTGRRHTAHLVGTRLSLPDADIRLLIRYYAPSFYTPYGAGISALGVTGNESGMLSSIRWRPIRSMTITAWADRFRRPGGVSSPSSIVAGTRFGLLGHRRLGRHWTTDLSIRLKFDTRGTSQTESTLKRTVRGEVTWEPEDRIRAKVEVTHVHQKRDDPSQGSASYLDLRVGPLRGYTIRWRTTTFIIGSYDARITEIEYDAPGAIVPVIMTRPGIKHHIVTSYRRNDRQWSVSYRLKRDRASTSARLFFQTDMSF